MTYRGGTKETENNDQLLRGMRLLETQLDVRAKRLASCCEDLSSSIGTLNFVSSALTQLLQTHVSMLKGLEYGESSLLARCGDELIKDMDKSLQSLCGVHDKAPQPEIRELDNYECSVDNKDGRFRPDISGDVTWNFDASSSVLKAHFIEPVTLSQIKVRMFHKNSNSIENINNSYDDCDGDWQKTSVMVSQVISWESLIKSTPPEKFLRRPPVRFLFDLFQALLPRLGRTGSSPDVVSLMNSKWEDVGSTKDSKVAFMENVIYVVARGLDVEPATTGNNIVTGSEATMTNMLIQQLVVLILKESIPSHVPPTPPPTAASDQFQKLLLECYDASDALTSPRPLDLKSANRTEVVSLHGNVRGVTVAQLCVVKCDSASDVTGTLRVGFRGYLDTSVNVSSAIERVLPEDILKILSVQHACVAVLLKSSSHIDRVEEQRVQHQQEELKKVALHILFLL